MQLANRVGRQKSSADEKSSLARDASELHSVKSHQSSTSGDSGLVAAGGSWLDREHAPPAHGPAGFFGSDLDQGSPNSAGNPGSTQLHSSSEPFSSACVFTEEWQPARALAAKRPCVARIITQMITVELSQRQRNMRASALDRPSDRFRLEIAGTVIERSLRIDSGLELDLPNLAACRQNRKYDCAGSEKWTVARNQPRLLGGPHDMCVRLRSVRIRDPNPRIRPELERSTPRP
jgi:hypothetical protein